MTTTLELPQLSGGRRRADFIVAPIRDHLRGAVVVLDCRQLVAGTSSFADELVRLILVEGAADRLSVQHVRDNTDFYGYLLSAARDHGQQSKLTFE